jgi:predicted acetyltransferase
VDLELRTPTPDDLQRVFDVRAQAFAVPESDRERWTNLVDPSGMVAAYLGGEVVGALNIIGLGQWFGGRSIPMGGIATVVVRPEHRGQGVAARLLERSLEEMRERELHCSTLHPATTRVYRNAGWEIGGDLASYRIPTRALERVPPGEPDRLRRLTSEDWELVIACYDAVAPSQPGWVDRSPWWWKVCEDQSFEDQAFLYGVQGDDGLDGFVSFVQEQSPAAGGFGAPKSEWGYKLEVHEMVTRDATAAATLWRFLGTHGMQASAVTLVSAPIEPLLLMLPEQEVELRQNNRWMHRLVDARAALGTRGYPPGVSAEVHLELVDKLAPWNEGRFVLRVEGGRGELEPGGDGTVQLGINGLSTLSTGWAGATLLAEAGALHHADARDRAALHAAIAGPRPSTIDEF